MKTVCSTLGTISADYPKQGILDMRESGFLDVCLDLELPYTEDVPFSEKYNSVFLKFKEGGITPILASSPYLQYDTKRTGLNDFIINLTKKSINLCGQYGCKYLIVKPLFLGINDEDMIRVNRDFYMSLVPNIIKNNTIILFENICKYFNGHFTRGVFSDADEIRNFTDELNNKAGKELFRVCADIGVCNLCGQDMRDFVVKLGNKIDAIRVRDCSGHDDGHMIPFLSNYKGVQTTDWLGLFRGMREIKFSGNIVLDIADAVKFSSPLFRQEILRLAYREGEYFKLQIELEDLLKKYKHVVLFGAGNMFKNYMKYYGEKYPPLFTCDNNNKLWESTIYGVKIKSPEELKNISEDCGVFIASSYYRDIKEQLLGMGVKNIEIFNDEYLPGNPLGELKGGAYNE